MRKRFAQQLEILNSEMVEMGELCEKAIKNAVHGLVTGEMGYSKKLTKRNDRLNSSV